MDGVPGDGGSNFETPESVHPKTLEPDTPNIVVQGLSFIAWLLTSFGWPCLILGVLCGVLWNKYSPALAQWKRRREEEQEAALYHKNPDLFLARESAVERARQRLQEQYEQQAREHAEKQKAKEAQKQKEKLAAYDAQQSGSGGRRLVATETPSTAPQKKTDKKKPTFRQDFYPLMGAGGSSGFRAARRSGRSGG